MKLNAGMVKVLTSTACRLSKMLWLQKKMLLLPTMCVYLHFIQKEVFYLDSDVLVKKPIDPFLADEFFCGTEAFWANNELHYRMEPAIMGAIKGHPFVEKCMTFYHNNVFSLEKTVKEFVMPKVISQFAEELGYIYENREQKMAGITVYPTSVFSNTLHLDTSNPEAIYAIHQNAGSWIDYSDRGWFFRFCRKCDMMKLYHWIEKLHTKKS